MVQKITWMRFLAIGISISFLLISCDKGGTTEYISTTNFIYKNLTDQTVEIKLYNSLEANFKNYIIEPNSEIAVSLTQDGGPGLGQPFAFEQNVNDIATKGVIKFQNSNNCLTQNEGIGIFYVKDYDNYSVSMNNNLNNTLIYNIDDEELNLASACN